jgi:hypothetical protein
VLVDFAPLSRRPLDRRALVGLKNVPKSVIVNRQMYPRRSKRLVALKMLLLCSQVADRHYPCHTAMSPYYPMLLTVEKDDRILFGQVAHT